MYINPPKILQVIHSKDQQRIFESNGDMKSELTRSLSLRCEWKCAALFADHHRKSTQPKNKSLGETIELQVRQTENVRNRWSL